MVVVVEIVVSWVLAEVIARRKYPVTAIRDFYGVGSNYYRREAAVAGWTIFISFVLLTLSGLAMILANPSAFLLWLVYD